IAMQSDQWQTENKQTVARRWQPDERRCLTRIDIESGKTKTCSQRNQKSQIREERRKRFNSFRFSHHRKHRKTGNYAAGHHIRERVELESERSAHIEHPCEEKNGRAS